MHPARHVPEWRRYPNGNDDYERKEFIKES